MSGAQSAGPRYLWAIQARGLVALLLPLGAFGQPTQEARVWWIGAIVLLSLSLIQFLTLRFGAGRTFFFEFQFWGDLLLVSAMVSAGGGGIFPAMPLFGMVLLFGLRFDPRKRVLFPFLTCSAFYLASLHFSLSASPRFFEISRHWTDFPARMIFDLLFFAGITLAVSRHWGAGALTGEPEKSTPDQKRLSSIQGAAARLAHEIRNPLGALSGSLQVLKSEIGPERNESRLFAIALKECDRLNRITEGFLTYSKPQPLSLERVDVARLVENTLQLFKNHPELRENHRLEVIIPPEGLDGWVDPGQIQQLVWNLFTNAIRAMPNGGRLRVELGDEQGSTVLRISDEGTGMSDEELERLFEPFHSGFGKGVGLGMTIVRQIVDSHKGEISVESRVGEGTRIEVRLPARATAASR